MMRSIKQIEGVNETYAQRLKEAGVGAPDAFLTQCATPKGRQDVADRSGISAALILKWANRVDLSRIRGVSEQYSDLLEASGVDTVPELAQRNAASLFTKMGEVNAARKLVRRLPTQSQVAEWIQQASILPRRLQY